MNVALFDYGTGNLHSLARALEASGARVALAGDPAEALRADALVLPGVGAFGAAAARLAAAAADVRAALEDGLPCLAVCLGMQLLFDGSEEGEGAGLGVIPGRVRRLRARQVPHMGWNDVEPEDVADPVVAGRGLVAYYAHSYACEPADPAAAVAWTTYEGKRFAAAVRRGRTWGVQFHPEKSGEAGLALIGRFLAEAGR